MELFAHANYNILAKRKIAIAFSALLILIGIVSLVIHGGPRLGIDFLGGTLMQFKFEKPVEVKQVRSALDQLGLAKGEIQQFGANDEILIRVLRLEEKEGIETSQAIQAQLKKTLSDNPFEVRRVEQVGPKIGGELQEKALFAIFFALLGIVIYVSIRFEFKFAIAGIIALIHDVLITLGVFSVLNLEMTLPIIAAFLTIVGYSLNDTIIVFDRVRENLKAMRRDAYDHIVNLSINQTLSRTVVTSLTTFVVVLVLWLGGGEVIKNFAFALVIGVAVGTYSSIYIASPVIVEWEARTESKSKLHAKKRR